jgi:hypothetical protein
MPTLTTLQDAEEILVRPEEIDIEALLRLGDYIDTRFDSLKGSTFCIYLAEKILRVRTRAGLTEPLIANPAQQMFERRRQQHNIVLKARQMGLTTWAAARFLLSTITHPGALTLQVAHTQESAEDIFRIVHRFVEWLPDNLRTGVLRTSHTNVRQMIFPEIDAQYRVVSAGERNAGRGLTVQYLHCSELARWPNDPAETLAGLRAAMTRTAVSILESTPDGVGGCFHEEWQKAPETGMVKHFFPWWLEPSYRAPAVDRATVTEEEMKLLKRYNLDFEQIAYRRQLRAGFRGLARQEYAEDSESCFLASGESVFELDLLEKRLNSTPKPIEERRNGQLCIWLPPLAGKHYLVAVDPAGGGTEGDYSAAQVIDLATGLQCAEFAGHVGGLELAQFIAALATEYNQAIVVVERNNHGSGILAYLQSPCAYPHIFAQNGQPGFLTTSLSRPAMLGRLGAALVEEPDRFLSRRLLEECRGFVRLPHGSSGARAGMHDDRVLAMAIALAAREQVLGVGGQV